MGCCSLSFFFLAGYFGEAFQPSRPRPYATFVQCASRFFLSLVPYVEKSVREHWFALSSFFFFRSYVCPFFYLLHMSYLVFSFQEDVPSQFYSAFLEDRVSWVSLA